MYFNKRIFKFLAAMSLGACVISSFNGFVLGMEDKENLSNSKEIADKIFEQIKKSAPKSIEFRLLSYIFENLHMILHHILTTNQISFYKEMDFNKFLGVLENWIEFPFYYHISTKKLMKCSLGNNTKQKCIKLIFESISFNANNNKITRENVEILDNVITILSKRCHDFFNEKIELECPLCSSNKERDFVAPCCSVHYHGECWEKWTNFTKPCCPCCDCTIFI